MKTCMKKLTALLMAAVLMCTLSRYFGGGKYDHH